MAIAIAQYKKGDDAGANRTIESIQIYTQYQDDGYHELARLQMEKNDFRKAVVTAGRIRQSSKRAVALLSIAKAVPLAGDHHQAIKIATHIDLPCEGLFDPTDGTRFQFDVPRTWGLKFDSSHGMPSLWAAIERSAEVASAAMSLAILLHRPSNESRAVDFDRFYPEVVVALAREQARSGDANDALNWAHKIGSDKIEMTEEGRLRDSWGVQRRLHALIGVAEGILDRLGVAPTPQY